MNKRDFAKTLKLITLSERRELLKSRKFDYQVIPEAKKLYIDVDFRDVFSFTAVRNPRTRMESGYLHFLKTIEGKRMQMNMQIQRMQIVEEIRGIADKEKL